MYNQRTDRPTGTCTTGIQTDPLAHVQPAYRQTHWHMYNHLVISERPSPARLKSRRPFAEHAHRLLRSTPEDVSSRSWLSTRWNEEWRAAEHSRLHSFINTPDHVSGQDLPRRQWTIYNRIRTGVGRFGEAMKRWGLKSTSECECGAPNQSVQHIMDDCTMHRPPNGERGLADLDEDTRIWLASTSLEI